MPTTEKQLITKLYNERAKDDQNTKTLAHLIESVVLDTLSGEKYLNELLQNADDAASPDAEFVLVGCYLIFKHSGRHFNEDDVKGICDAANPHREKTRDLEQIGNKGMGFKAVFTMASTVYIYSKKYQFCFNEHHDAWEKNSEDYPWQLIPIPTALDDFPEEVQPYINIKSTKVTFIFKIREELQDDMRQHLEKLSTRYMLFLRHIKQLRCSIKNAGEMRRRTITLATPNQRQLSSSPSKKSANFEVVEHKINTKCSWWTYKQNYPITKALKQKLTAAKDKDIPEKYKAVEHLCVTLAVLVNDGKLVPISRGPKVFCYLPTDIDFGTKFLVNAEFLLDTSRMQLRDDLLGHAWNDFLIEAIFIAQVNFLGFLALAEDTFGQHVFDLFSEPAHVPERIKTSCEEAFKKVVAHTHLVENLPGESIGTISTRIIDDHQFIASFGNKALQADCVHPAITQRDLLKKYGAKSFGIDEIIATFKESWFLTLMRTPEKNEEFFKFIANLYAEIDSAKEKEKLKYALQTHALILSARGVLKEPSKIFFPEATLLYLTAKFNFLPILHPKLNATDAETKNFLKFLGIRKSSLDDVINWANNTPKELLAFTLKLIQKWPDLDKKSRNKFKALKLQTKNEEFADATECYLPDSHNPSHRLEQFMQGEGFLISDNYPGESGRAFLLALGVSERINSENIEQICQVLNEEANKKKIIVFTRWISSRFSVANLKEKGMDEALASLKVVDQNNQLQDSKNCYLPDYYNPQESLEMYGIKISYISTHYHKSDEENLDRLKEFFLMIGVRDRVEVTSHEDMLRNDLVAQDPAARKYFNDLERLTPGGLFLEITRRYMFQHRINYYVQISYVEHIFSSPLFWQILSREWSRIESSIRGVSYSTHCSNIATISTIHYWVQRAVQIAYDDEEQSPANFYGNQVKLMLGDKFSANLNIATITGELSFAQVAALGFKEHLTLTDCQQVLLAIATANKPQRDWAKITFVYKQLVSYADDESQKILDDLILPNEAHQFVLAEELSYVIDDLLPHTMNPGLIKKPSTIDEITFQKLCKLCGVRLISFSEITITPQPRETSETLKDSIKERLPYLVYLHGHDQNLAGEELSTFSTKHTHVMNKKLAKLRCFSAENFVVSYERITKDIELWFDSENAIIYHCPLESLDLSTQSKLYKFLLTYFSFSIHEEDFISIMSLPPEKIIRKYPILSGVNSQSFAANTDVSARVKSLPYKHDLEDDPDASVVSPTKKRALDSSVIASSSYGFFPLTREQRIQRGFFGEQAVYNYLKIKHSEKYGAKTITEDAEGYTIKTADRIKRIKWMNKTGESFASYDFEVNVEKDHIQKTRYLEVKTTRVRGDKVEVSLSKKEWKIAENDQTRYRLYLVGLNEDNSEPVISKHNLSEDIEKKKVIVSDYKRLTFSKF